MKGDNIMPFIILIILVFFVFNFYFALDITNDPNMINIFNPIRNYNVWKNFNWFGTIVCTIVLNIFFFPYAIIYWIYKLFTIGRK